MAFGATYEAFSEAQPKQRRPLKRTYRIGLFLAPVFSATTERQRWQITKQSFRLYLGCQIRWQVYRSKRTKIISR